MELEGPNFQNFTKEVIQNPLASNVNQRFDMYMYLNREDASIQDLYVPRTRFNLGRPIFQVVCGANFDKKMLTDIYNYCKSLTRMEYKNVQLDVGQTYSKDKFKKDCLYIVDLRVNDVKNRDIMGESVLNILLRDIMENVGGMIFVSDKVEKMPTIINTLSHLVFVEKDNYSLKEIEGILRTTGLLVYKADIRVDIDFLSVNKTTLWTKIANFNKFS